MENSFAKKSGKVPVLHARNDKNKNVEIMFTTLSQLGVVVFENSVRTSHKFS